MPKERATARMEAIKKRGRPRKRWTHEVEGNLKIMVTRNSRSGQRLGEMEADCVGSQGPQMDYNAVVVVGGGEKKVVVSVCWQRQGILHVWTPLLKKEVHIAGLPTQLPQPHTTVFV
jgi:hypothetical protein